MLEEAMIRHAARQPRTPGATRSHRHRLRKANGKRVLRDIVVDQKPFDEMLKAMGVRPEHLIDSKRIEEEAAQILNDLARRWQRENVTRSV
jgi:hypothetical protein